MKIFKRAGYYGRIFIPLVVGFMFMSTAYVSAGTTHRVGVDGLACPFCAYGIEKQLSALPGVKSVRVSVKSGTVIVTMRDGAKLSRASASRAVRNAGFSLRSFR